MMEKKEKFAGNVFLELQQIEKLQQTDEKENIDVLGFTEDFGGWHTILCC